MYELIVGYRPIWAFTLVEMLLVIVILACFAGGVIVSVQGRSDNQALRIAAKDLAQAVRFSCYQAQVKQMPYRIHFLESSQSFRVEYRPSTVVDYVPVPGRGGRYWLFSQGIRLAGVQGQGQSYDRDMKMLDFFPNGTGFNGTITLQNRLAQTLSINVISLTHQVSIQEETHADNK